MKKRIVEKPAEEITGKEKLEENLVLKIHLCGRNKVPCVQ